MNQSKKAMAFFVVNTITNLAASFAHPVTPTVIQTLQLPDYMFGLALAVMMTTMFLFSPFWGKINSYISSRVSLAIVCVGYAGAQALFGLAQGMSDVIIARLLAGCFTSGLFVASLAYVANTSPEEKRGQYLTVYATIQSVGSAFGYFIGGMLGELGTGYAFAAQVVLLAASSIGYLFVCVPDATMDKSDLHFKSMVKDCNPFAAFAAGKTFLNATWTKLLGVCCFSYVAYNAFEQVFNYYIKDQFGFSSSYNGTIKFAVGIIALVANSTICLYLIHKTDTRKTTIPILAVATVAILGTIIAPILIVFFAMAIIYFAFNSVSVPLTQNLVADRAENGDSNLIMGFYQAVRAIGGVAGALLAGLLYTFNPKVPFVFACVGMAISVLCEVGYYRDCRKEDAIAKK